MFESAELGHSVDEATFARELPGLRAALLEAQYELVQRRGFQVILVISGVDGGGRRESVRRLNEWLDPRHIETHGMGPPSDEERQRPEMWRFWRVLPPRGKFGIFQGSWYSQPFIRRVYGKIKGATLDEALERRVRFENMLADEGALILKFWFHLSRDRQKRRLEALARDPATRWRVTERDWRHFELYDRFIKTAERMVRITSTPQAPWFIIDGSDDRYRSLALGRILLEALRQRLNAAAPPHPVANLPALPQVNGTNVLRALDLGKSVDKASYDSRLEALQGRLATLVRTPRFQKRHAAVVVFEGHDAAGKGGSIRRITGALDARFYQVIPIASPTDEERAQPYLWRFWRHIPSRGRLAMFDRSWYGRVLVERVEGYCTEYDWLRAYNEINDFEHELHRHGLLVVKFWLAISQQEQLRRFQEREQIPFKHFKITEEDWRNRAKWDLYEQAVCDMVSRTSCKEAPWVLVEAEDKRHARLKVLQTLCDRIEQSL